MSSRVFSTEYSVTAPELKLATLGIGTVLYCLSGSTEKYEHIIDSHSDNHGKMPTLVALGILFHTDCFTLVWLRQSICLVGGISMVLPPSGKIGKLTWGARQSNRQITSSNLGTGTPRCEKSPMIEQA